MAKLNHHRLIESVKRAQVFQISLVRRAGFAGEDVDQIAGRQFQDQEVDAADQKQDHQDLTKPPDHVFRDDQNSLQLTAIA